MKIVQIGTGGWGKNHTRILSQLGVLSAVCDVNAERSKEYGEKYSVNHYSSLDDLIKSEEFDGAFVVTPTSTHTEIATKLLEAKKHVFVEKPMTYKSEDGQRIAELAEKNKVILTCGYIERFNPAVDTVKIGENTKIEGQAYIPPLSRIGKNVFIGPAAVLTNDPYPMCDKMIGVTIKDNAIIGARAVIKAGVTIGKNCFLGVNSTVNNAVSIGDDCLLSSAALVVKNIPEDSIVKGKDISPISCRAYHKLTPR